ncbi:hypothetical protein ACQP3D_30685, partial [Escherichia coli]
TVNTEKSYLKEQTNTITKQTNRQAKTKPKQKDSGVNDFQPRIEYWPVVGEDYSLNMQGYVICKLLSSGRYILSPLG